MTVASPLAQAGPFAGDGGNTVFPFSFQVFKPEDVRAVRTRRAGALFFDTELHAGTDFSVTVQADQRSNPGGTVTLAAPLQTDETLTLLRRVQATQNTAIPNQGGFYPEVIEAALDKLTMLVQQLETDLRRALLLSVADTGTSMDGLLRGIKSAEEAIAAARQAAGLSAQEAAAARDVAGAAVTQAQAAQAEAQQQADRAEALVAGIANGPVVSVNGQQGGAVVLTPAHLGLLPNQPTDGPTTGALTRDAAGVLTGASFTVEGQGVAAAIHRDGQGRIASVVTTRGGKRRTVTLARDAQGRIAAFTGAMTDV